MTRTNDHAVNEESQLGATDDGTVMLDIGGDIGALIIMTDASMHRAEIEISPASEGAEDVFQRDHGPAAHEHSHGGHVHTHRPGTTHVAVRERRGPGGVRYAAIYPGLREGDYTVWAQDGTPAETVHVTGGEVVQLDWS